MEQSVLTRARRPESLASSRQRGAFDTVVDVDRLTKCFRKHRSRDVVTVVDGISFRIGRGAIVGLLGPNGAGKTTTIKTICGLLVPDGGRVLVNGFDVQRARAKALRNISAVFESDRNLYWRLTVTENMEYFAGNRGWSRRAIQSRMTELLERFRLAHKADELVGRLSRGMRQKLAIAVAMLADTEVILLDEPTLGLDVEAGYEMRGSLREIVAGGRTIIISTHDMSLVQDICERVIIIDSGRVVVDSMVDELRGLAGTHAYLVTLRGPLSAEQRTALRNRFPFCRYVDGELPRLTVGLADGEDIFELMDVLKRERTPVESVERTATDVEQVFREIVRPTDGP